MRKYINILINSFLAGVAIAISGFISLRANVISSNSIIGAILFSFGLLIICSFNYNLYTGKICYLLEKTDEKIKNKLINLFIILVGNLFGTLFVATAIKFSLSDNSTNNQLVNTLKSIVDSKLNYSWYQSIVLSFFCGMLVYIAVESFKSINWPLGKYLILILAISGFIICGFEHSIANMFYYFLNSTFNIKIVLSLILFIIGNSLGGLFIPALNKFLKQ